MAKTIVITGAGVGLGRALARRFTADGDAVVLLGRTFSKVEAVANELGDAAMAVECDVSSPDSVRAAFAKIAEKHPKIDVLINNAALYQPIMLREAKDSDVLATLLTNLAGPIYCAREAIPMLGKGGHIINVSSESVAMNFPMLGLYQITKAGLERFSEALHRELQAEGIRVTNVRAGQMMDEDKVWEVEPQVAMRFMQECMKVGLDLRSKPITHFKSVVNAFRAVIDMPADLHVPSIVLEARVAG